MRAVALEHSQKVSRLLFAVFAGIWLGVIAPSGVAVAGIHSIAGPPPSTLRLNDLDGRERALSEFAGRVVVVNFWASWCGPCIEEMPSMQRLAETMAGKPFAMVGVNVAEGRLRAKQAVDRIGVDFPILLDNDSAVFKRWGATLLPSSYVLDGQGALRYVIRGPVQWDDDDVIAMLAELLAEIDAGSSTAK